MSAHLRVGQWGEDLAVNVLQNFGYSLVERNWRPQPVPGIETVRGEIDAVMIDPDMNLVFVEVKTRSSLSHGHPLDAINEQKKKKLKFLAYSWCSSHEELDFGSIRLDAVAITGDDEDFHFEHLKWVG